jgi:chromosome segregation ATPase
MSSPSPAEACLQVEGRTATQRAAAAAARDARTIHDLRRSEAALKSDIAEAETTIDEMREEADVLLDRAVDSEAQAASLQADVEDARAVAEEVQDDLDEVREVYAVAVETLEQTAAALHSEKSRHVATLAERDQALVEREQALAARDRLLAQRDQYFQMHATERLQHAATRDHLALVQQDYANSTEMAASVQRVLAERTSEVVLLQGSLRDAAAVLGHIAGVEVRRPSTLHAFRLPYAQRCFAPLLLMCHAGACPGE